MIPLPPGCTLTNNIRIQAHELTDEMVNWIVDAGGNVATDSWYDFRGNQREIKYISYGRGKRCHISNSGDVTLHFQAEDGPVALAFIIKFMNEITRHNFPEFN